MADDVLKAYLVSIGFKVDQADYKKFKDSQEETKKRTDDLSKAFGNFAKVGAGTAISLGASVLAITSKLEGFYFASQRTKASATNLQAFGKAAEQIGVSSEDAIGSVHKLNELITSAPGAVHAAFGVDESQDRVKVLLDTIDVLSKKSQLEQNAYAKMLGIDPENMRMLVGHREELRKYFDANQKLFANLDEQAKRAHDANQPLRDLENKFGDLTNRIGDSFVPVMKELIPLLSKAVDFLIQADKSTEGWSSRLVGLTTALAGTVGGLKALGLLGSIFGKTGVTAAAGAGSTVAGIAGVGVTGGLLAKYGIDIKSDTFKINAQRDLDSVANNNRVEINLGRLFTQETGLDRATHGVAYNKWLENKRKQKTTNTSGLSDDFLSRHPAFDMRDHRPSFENNPGNLRSFGDAPTAERFRDGKSIGKFAMFDSADEGLQAMAGLLTGKGYAGAGRDTITSILNRYAPGKENNTQSYISDVSARTGFDPNAHLNLNDVSVLSKLMAAMIHHEQGKDPFSMSMITSAANKRLVSQSEGNRVMVKMDQKTDIHVNGRDAKDTAELVARNQNQVNASLARDFAGAVQ